MSSVTKKWRAERRKDHYYRKAKREHYRSRASYKLQQLNGRFGLIRPGDVVVDLGASPGGWSQVAAELSSPNGRVFALDLERMAPLKGVTFIRGDIRDDAVASRLLEHIHNGADVVLSDMSPNISGQYSYDHARSVELCEHALGFATRVLRNGGNILVKMFFGDMSKGFVEKVRRSFAEVHVHRPKASRASSSEVYVVGLGYRGRRG